MKCDDRKGKGKRLQKIDEPTQPASPERRQKGERGKTEIYGDKIKERYRWVDADREGLLSNDDTVRED